MITAAEEVGSGPEDASAEGLPVAAGSGADSVVDRDGGSVVVEGEDIVAEEPEASIEPDIVEVSVRYETVIAYCSASTSATAPRVQLCNAPTFG